jgi:hypothetical protein
MSVEFVMERNSPRLSTSVVDAKVVRLQPKNSAAIGGSSLISTDETALPNLMKRASDAGRQMRYFGLVARKSSFNDLLTSARRAGFIPLNEDMQRKEATFQWSTGEPDFIFSVSFNDVARASVIAESCGDIFGLILTSYSHAPNVSVETNPSLGNRELGRNALLFREVLLMLPDFDDDPAWTKCLEPHASEVDGGFHWETIFDFAQFRRLDVTAISAISRTWRSILSQVSTNWGMFQDRWRGLR